jgi:hypothetical protein
METATQKWTKILTNVFKAGFLLNTEELWCAKINDKLYFQTIRRSTIIEELHGIGRTTSICQVREGRSSLFSQMSAHLTIRRWKNSLTNAHA